MERLYEIRKRLHKIPEIAYKEFKTQELIMEIFNGEALLKLIRFEPTGLLYEYTQGEGEYLLFRADMDALPLTENTGCDYMSEHKGYFHACGHDIHLTALIGLMLHVLESRLAKNILFLFQPAEEGHGGAKHIIDTGIFDNYKIKAAFALHVTGQYPTGSIGIKSGIMLGIPQEFNVEIYGKSGHVATPQKGLDAFIAGMAFYQTVQSQIAKMFPVQEPIIFHIGKVSAGQVRNIIPNYCLFEGTFRCLKKEIKEKVLLLMNDVAESLKLSHKQKHLLFNLLL